MSSLNSISKKLKKYKNKKVILIGGCFDLLHIGHLRILNKAKKLGDILVVGINNDSFIKKTKGKNRPIIPQDQRAELLLGLKAVDYVFITNKELYSENNLEKIKPDFLIFGKEKNKIKRRRETAKKLKLKFPKTKTVFLSSGLNNIRTSLIERKIINNNKKLTLHKNVLK